MAMHAHYEQAKMQTRIAKQSV